MGRGLDGYWVEGKYVDEQMCGGVNEQMGGWVVIIHIFTDRLSHVRRIYSLLSHPYVLGYGQSGPYMDRAGYDVIAAGTGGLLHITGPQDGDPARVGVAITDITTGLYAHGAILAALIQRQQTAAGQHIDCNLLSTQVKQI